MSVGTVQKKKRVKTSEPNLLRLGDVYYYRKGAIEKSLGKFDLEREAVKAKRAFEAKLGDVGLTAFRFTVGDTSHDYIDDRRRQFEREKISEATWVECESLWRLHLTPFFAKKRLSAIDERMWSAFVDQAKVNDLSNLRKVFGHYLGWCKQQGYIRMMPDLKIPKVERRERRILKPAEMIAILKAAKGDLLLFATMYLTMGMRASETIKLPWARVNFDTGALWLSKAATKTRRARSMKINPWAFRLLTMKRDEQVKAKIKTEWVFPVSTDPRRPKHKSSMRKAWKATLVRAKLGDQDITPHDLRATYETYANKRTDFTDAQREKFAGATISMQKSRYVDFDADDTKGLETVVEVQGLQDLFEAKFSDLGKNTGKRKRKRHVDTV